MGTIQALRGTRDILPSEVAYWQQAEDVARQILSLAAYREIRTPIFEPTELFERGIGEATDVVGKEMYTFKDKGERSVTLRPEGTAGVVRSYIENHLDSKGGVQRLWYIGPMFRYERPMSGRQRQFHQLGVELLGSADTRADAEVMALAINILQTLGLQDLSLEINSVGNLEDRQGYRQALVDYLTPYEESLDPDSQTRLSRNPLRILDTKEPSTQAILENAPSILDYLGADSRRYFEQIQQHLSDLGIAYKINPRLVRGLDYYTHLAFEIVSANLGAQATVCGGGRYNGLVAELGGPDTSAVGWAIGLERLILLLQQLQAAPTPKLDFYLVSRGSGAESQALKLAQSLRCAGFAVELDLSGSPFAKQLKRASRSGAVAGIILGDAEAENNTVQIKWLKSGEQQALAQTDLLEKAEELRHCIAQQGV